MAAPAWAQFDLSVIQGNTVTPAPAVYDIGSVYGGETAAARFRLRNVSATPVTAPSVAVAGVGFFLADPVPPVILDPQAAVEFVVSFRAADLGAYSAVLRAANVTILLTATVQARLTYRVEDGPLGASVDFGTVVRGSSSRRRFTVVNETALILIVPAISVQAGDFAMVGASPSGMALGPAQSTEFSVDFAPSIAGVRQGVLTLGDRSYALTGIGSEPPVPKPVITLEVRPASSGEQWSLGIAFDTAAAIAGTGTATLDFAGAADPTIVFANGTRTVNFAVRAGDTRFSLPFQTGTTAGTLTFAVSFGGASAEASLPIAKAPPNLGAPQGLRTLTGVEVSIQGFDNTRSVSQLSFTFFDAAGNAIAPGAIRVDASGEFTRYFAGSDLGGIFLFRGVFPVAGDTAQVRSFEVTMTDAVGTTQSFRTTF